MSVGLITTEALWLARPGSCVQSCSQEGKGCYQNKGNGGVIQ
jgi:hypothetical protein